MPPRSARLLNDIIEAARFILSHTAERSLDDYLRDRLLSAAVERHFIIIGEALGRLTRENPTIAAKLGACPPIISFRNIIVHGYDTLDDGVV